MEKNNIFDLLNNNAYTTSYFLAAKRDEAGRVIKDENDEIEMELALKKVSFAEKFEIQRKNIGKAFGLSNEILELSKKIPCAIKDNLEYESLSGQMRVKFNVVTNLDLPRDFSWEIDGRSGQEMVEALHVVAFLDHIINGNEVGKLYFHRDFPHLTEAAYLAGMGDVPGELSKIMNDYFVENIENISKEDCLAIRKRFLKIAKDIYDFLSQFETAYGKCIDNSHYRGYGNTFRGLLGRVRGIIDYQQTKILGLAGL